MEWANGNGLRVAAYAVAAAVALVAYLRERRSADRADWWPAFWLITAIVLGAMALGRILDLDALTSFARNEAISDGWYEDRRRLQVLVVGTVGGFWAVSVLIALWRVPERRRRYLPTAVVVFSLLCFAAIRLVSLHHVDSVLHRRDVDGVRIGTLVELAGVAIAIVIASVVTATTRTMPRPARALVAHD